MFILLNKNREMVGELIDWLTITANIRFSSPGQLSVTLAEDSDEAKMITELMHIFYVETSTLFLVDYIERNVTYNDAKAVIVKGITIEGFLDQRIIYTDKLLEGVAIQTAINDLFTENVFTPADTTRTLDFYTFVDSTDPHVTGVTVKGLISGISVMQCITSLLESKNLGYKVTYNILTKKASFMIVAGRNLCAGFTSIVHGTNLVNTVTLSAQSETLKDIKSVIDLAPHKTRVYVRNFDDLKIFNRGESESGINLREGYLSTGHGTALGEFAELPPLPEVVIPPITFPGPIEVPTAPLKTNLIGLYVLTSTNRILACSFYPNLPVPELWQDVTPTYVENETFILDGSGVIIEDGSLIIGSADRRKIYRAPMEGGWFGARWFSEAEPIFDVATFDLVPGMGARADNFISGFGVDVRTGRIAGGLASGALSSPWFSNHTSVVFNGTPYGLEIVSTPSNNPLGFPGFFGRWPIVSVNRNLITMSGYTGTMSSGVVSFDLELGTWKLVAGGTYYDYLWHARPEPESDVVYFGTAFPSADQYVLRSKNMFNIDGVPTVIEPGIPGPYGPFSLDGKTMIGNYASKGFTATMLDPDILANSTKVSGSVPGDVTQSAVAISSAGTNSTTGEHQWGFLMTGNGTDGHLYPGFVYPSYYISADSTFTVLIDQSPLLKTFLAFDPGGPGLNVDGSLIETPVFAWPILG